MNPDTVQLVKCLVRNRGGETSCRLIEKDNYDLWHYLVTTKHQIEIEESSICLWISQQTFVTKQEIYLRAGKFEEANRILLMTYDNNANFTNSCRYVLESDTDAVKSILYSHIPEQQRNENQFTLSVEPGQLITKGVFAAKKEA